MFGMSTSLCLCQRDTHTPYSFVHWITCSLLSPSFSITKLDRGSKRSSTRYGLSTPYSLTIRNSARLFHHVLFNMGVLHLVLPALNLSTLNAGIYVILMMFSLNMVDYSMSVVAHEILVLAQGPLVLGFWVFEFGVWGFGA